MAEVVRAAGAIVGFLALLDAPSRGAHIMGTLRMGEDPTISACAPSGRFHDLGNPYCAGGVLLPTSSGFNPTLTIQVLAYWGAGNMVFPGSPGAWFRLCLTRFFGELFSMFDLSGVLTQLSAALGLSLAVERVLELLQHLLAPFLWRAVPVAWDARDSFRRLEDGESELRASEVSVEQLDARIAAGEQGAGVWSVATLQEGALSELEESVGRHVVVAEPATVPDDSNAMKVLLLQLLGFALGIAAASVSQLTFFSVLLDPFLIQPLIASVDHVLTGLLIGGGSKPVHVLIRLVTQYSGASTPRSGVSLSLKPSAAEVARTGTPASGILIPAAAATEDSQWVDIPYEGGIDRDALEYRHLRKQDPEWIVVHHTAMHSGSEFDDVCRVIKSKGWLTGYHCVITADGGIHTMCRWDRFGNHAKGFNLSSLGVAFNGNFETERISEFTNADGRFGNKRPTDAQLKAGARLIALWMWLYGIRREKVGYHGELTKTTVCPGSNFPREALDRWIQYFAERWSTSGRARQHLETFQKRSFLYIKREQ